MTSLSCAMLPSCCSFSLGRGFPLAETSVSDSALLFHPSSTSCNHLLVHVPYQLGDVFFQALAPHACTMGTQASEAGSVGQKFQQGQLKLFMSHKKKNTGS